MLLENKLTMHRILTMHTIEFHRTQCIDQNAWSMMHRILLSAIHRILCIKQNRMQQDKWSTIHRIQCIKKNAQNTQYTMLIIQCIEYNSMHRIQCTEQIEWKSMHGIQCIKYKVQNTRHIIKGGPNLVYLISRAQVLKSSKFLCLFPIIRGVLWGVDIKILKIREPGLKI